uniref:G-protein coupled receptors family 1 profile domain-containing protein n=1 Tax=Anopheles atroparvus TaxID=41427 RepID=A0A182JEC1_ANOAO
MAMSFHRGGPRHKRGHLGPSMCFATSRAFGATLLLILISTISIGVLGARDLTGETSGSEWRPPEPERWTPLSGHADSSVTSLTGSLDQTAQSQRRGPGQGSARDGGAGDPIPSTTHARVASVHQPPPSGWLKSFEAAEKHFLFRRDLGKTQDALPRLASSVAWTWVDNRTRSICQDTGPGSMGGSCTPSQGAPGLVLMTRASNGTGTEDFLHPVAHNRTVATNGSAFLSLEELELATLQSPLEENQTTHYYTVVNLDNHNDVLCDDEYQLEYNENCFIDHNVTCVGDPDFCNLTYDEYRQLLMDYIYPSTGEWILIASHTVVFIMGLVGNALVCIAVYTNHTMRTVTNIFIVNLAVADFFVILFCLPPTVVWDVTETWFMGKAMCKVVIYFQVSSYLWHATNLFK